MKLELKIFDRSPENLRPGTAGEFFVNSYLGHLFAIGLIALTLPFILIFVDWVFIDGRQIR